MEKPKALVLSGFGINCECETAHALELGGAECENVHFNQLLGGEKKLEDYQILALPGGFSFGDDIASGRVLANKFRYKLLSPMKKFIDGGKPVLGICNGFQVLVQLGALPGWDNWGGRPVSLIRNCLGKFEDRWIKMRSEASVCTFSQGCEYITAPVRHGEGQVALRDKKALERLIDNRQIVFRYASSRDGMAADSYPDNPNGSADAIAGICNEAGNAIGLMPHPECHVRHLQSPGWPAKPMRGKEEGEGLLSSISSFFNPAKSAFDDGNSIEFFRAIGAAGKKFI